MPPDDDRGMTPQAVLQALFTAIEAGRFERIPDIAAKYTRSVQKDLANAEGQTNATPLHEIVKPLSEALQYLRLVRAHQSTRFQKLASDTLYRSPGLVSKGRTLQVDA